MRAWAVAALAGLLGASPAAAAEPEAAEPAAAASTDAAETAEPAAAATAAAAESAAAATPATPAPPATVVTPPPATLAATDDPATLRGVALDHFAAERYALAAAAFDQLARLTTDDTDRFWANGLAAISRERSSWAPQIAQEDAEANAARRARRRTTGELALLYIDGVLYGMGTGAGLALVNDADEAASVVLPALALGAAAAGGLALADHYRPFGYGVPRSISAGLRLGLLEGVLWTTFAQVSVRQVNELGDVESFLLVWGPTTLGAVAGGLVGERLGSTPGAAALVESAGLWAAVVGGLLAGGLVDDIDGENNDGIVLSAALALNVGAIGGVFLAAETAPSVARVRYLDLGGLSGAVLFGGLYLALAGEDQIDGSVLALTTAFGTVGGIGTAWMLTRGLERDDFAAREETVSLGVAPTDGGAMIGLGGAWTL